MFIQNIWISALHMPSNLNVLQFSLFIVIKRLHIYSPASSKHIRHTLRPLGKRDAFLRRQKKKRKKKTQQKKVAVGGGEGSSQKSKETRRQPNIVEHKNKTGQRAKNICNARPTPDPTWELRHVTKYITCVSKCFIWGSMAPWSAVQLEIIW